MKLHKLLYYCQAWSLVWDEAPLFDEHIEAWANGPVVPEVYQLHRGEFLLRGWPYGDSDNLTEEQRETIERVLDFYGGKTAQWLSDLTHREQPWQEAREGLGIDERGGRFIRPASLHEYYSSL